MSDVPTTSPTPEPAENPERPAWLIPAIVAAAIAAVVIIGVILANNGDDDESAESTTTSEEETTTTSEEETTTTSEGESTTTSEEETTTSEEETTTTEAPADGPEVELSIDNGDPVTFVVTKCDNPGETTLLLEAESKEEDEDADKIELELDATDGEGTIMLSGREEAEGTVDDVMVGDTGEITASGELTASDDEADATPYELVGNCA